MREGLIRRPFVALAALSLLLFLTAAFALTERTPSADAADSETAALIGLINAGRSSPLSVSGAANADAQAAAQNAVDACGYTYGLNGHNAILVSYGFTTAQAIYDAWTADSYYSNVMNNSNYHSVGIGRAKKEGCNLGYLWVAYFDRAGGDGTTTTPTHTPSPTPSKTPTPTPVSSLTPTPTITDTSTPTPTPPDCAGVTEVSTQCTLTPTAPPTDSPAPTFTPPVGDPTPSPPPEMPGDADCDLDVDSEDGILALMLAANLNPNAPCLGVNGVNCQGSIDITDVMAILSFIGNIPFELPVGCPPLGVIVTPSPTPTPTPIPTPSPSPTPILTPTPPTGETPLPSITPAGEAVHHCLLALISYQLDTMGDLSGEVHCTPAVGTEYECYFGNINASCAASTSTYPDYTCSFATGLADCLPSSGEPEYQCFNDTPGAVECLPTQSGYPTYECAVADGTVTCTSDMSFPNFVCTKQTFDFDCFAQSPQ